MAFIETISDEQATGPVEDIFQSDRSTFGYVPNFARAFAHRPAAYQAWKQLNGAIKQTMDARLYELATVAAARRLRSSYCMLAHGKLLADRFMSPAEVRDLVLDHHAADLEPVEVAVMDLAERIVQDATSVTQADIDRLRELGLSEADILDVVLAAAARCFFSKVLDAVGLQADAVYAELEPGLRDALTVGRPIAAQP